MESLGTSRTTSRLTVLLAALVVVGIAVALLLRDGSRPAKAEVPFTQTLVAVGESVTTQPWTAYGPAIATTLCGGRGSCSSPTHFWRVARGAATARGTAFKVVERIKKYDFYVLDYDVTTSARTGRGSGGTARFTIASGGTTVLDRTDSRSIDATKPTCADIAVGMSTPWPVISVGTTVGHARLCDPGADLRRTTSGSDAVYTTRLLSAVRHLTMQRWVKVRAGAHPTFTLTQEVPAHRCTRGDGTGHCRRFAATSTTQVLRLRTTG